MKAINPWKAALGLTVSLAIPMIWEQPFSAHGQDPNLPPWQRPAARRDLTNETPPSDNSGQFAYHPQATSNPSNQHASMPGMYPPARPIPNHAYPSQPSMMGQYPTQPSFPSNGYPPGHSLSGPAPYPQSMPQPAPVQEIPAQTPPQGFYPHQNAAWQPPGHPRGQLAQQAGLIAPNDYGPMRQRDPRVAPVYYQDSGAPTSPPGPAPLELNSPEPQSAQAPMGTEMIDLSILDNSPQPAPASNTPPLPPMPSRVPSRFSDADLFEEIVPNTESSADFDSSQLSQSMVDYSLDDQEIEGEDLEELEGSAHLSTDEVIGGPGLLGSTLSRTANFASRGGLIGGVEATFLAPAKDSIQTLEMENLVDDSLLSMQTDFGFGSGIRTWAGIQSEAVGFRATYWSFDHSYFSPQSNIDPYSSPSLLNAYSLQASTIDIELINSFCFGRSTITTTLGGRFANMDREGAVTGHGKVGDIHLTGISRGVAELDGWGVVASVEGRHPLQRWFRTEACENPPLHLFWKLQGAGLQAETQVMAITEAHAISGGEAYAVAFSRDEALTTWDGTILTGMLQAGLDYRIPIAACHRPTFLDLRAGFEAQIWQTGDVGAESNSDAFLIGQVNGKPIGGEVRSHSLVNPSDIGLFGFTIGASLTY